MLLKHYYRSLVLLVYIFLPLVRGESDGYFITPPAAEAAADYTGNKIYYLGDTVPLQWNTHLDLVTLILWQQYNDVPAIVFCIPCRLEP